MTMQQAADKALMVQNGCNLSGIAIAFAEVLTEAIWPEARRIGEGTFWVNQHPICVLFISKLADLNAYSDAKLLSAWDAVEAMALSSEARGDQPA